MESLSTPLGSYLTPRKTADQVCGRTLNLCARTVGPGHSSQLLEESKWRIHLTITSDQVCGRTLHLCARTDGSRPLDRMIYEACDMCHLLHLIFMQTEDNSTWSLCKLKIEVIMKMPYVPLSFTINMYSWFIIIHQFTSHSLLFFEHCIS